MSSMQVQADYAVSIFNKAKNVARSSANIMDKTLKECHEKRTSAPSSPRLDKYMTVGQRVNIRV